MPLLLRHASAGPRWSAPWLRQQALVFGFPACIAAVTAIFAVVVALLYIERKDELRNATQNANNLALIVERDIARNFELYALSLQAVVEGFHDESGVMALPDALRDQILFDKAITATNVSSALILDVDGRVVVDSKSRDSWGRRFHDRDYFLVHRDNPDAGLYVSQPFISRLSDRPSLALSRRLVTDSGAFSGVAVLVLDLGYFNELLADLDLGEGGVSVLLNTEGVVIARQPGGVWQGASVSGSALFKQISAQGEGSSVAVSPLDGQQRLFVYKRVGQQNLFVVIGLATTDIYDRWWARVSLAGSVLALVGAGFVGLAFLLRREFRARLRAEEELRKLASVDTLTGLVNRRKLDAVLSTEWQRIKRGNEGLCVLFIDVDYFKPFNDNFGHQAGDQALAAVASALRLSVNRSSDGVARYGGEEFVVLLPQTAIHGASALAEGMRAAVQALAIAHPSSPYGVVTVSIGVAGSMMGEFANADALVKAADVALYEAKDAGRNRCALYKAAA